MSGARCLCLVLTVGLLTAGCGPLVGVRATVSLDERTRLERNVLGSRAVAAPRDALLSATDTLPTGDRGALVALLEEYGRLEQSLASLETHDAASRAWQSVLAHNRGVLHLWLGDRQSAEQAMRHAAKMADAWWLTTLQWQILAELGESLGDRPLLERAEEALMGAVLAERADYRFEAPRRRARLYSRLVEAAMADGDHEGALRLALRREAIELARAMPPGALHFPPGRLAELAAGLDDARRQLAAEREKRCVLSFASLTGGSEARRGEAWRRLRAVREVLAAESPVGGLLIPAPTDPAELRESLMPRTAILVVEPIGDDRFAVFLLPATAPPAAAVVEHNHLPEAAFATLSATLREVDGLYVAAPLALQGMDWWSAASGGDEEAGPSRRALLGGASDLPWAFRLRRYGRRSVLVCGGLPDAVADLPVHDEPWETKFLDVRRLSVEDVAEAAAMVDLILFMNPLEFSPGRPAATRLAWPGGLGNLRGLGIGELAGLSTRAVAVGCLRTGPEAFGPTGGGSLRVLLRTVMAAGTPSLVIGGRDVSDAFWREWLAGLAEDSVAGAFRRARGAIPGRQRSGVRLYGSLGFTASELAQFQRLDVNETFATARTELNAGRFRAAAGGFLDLWHMLEASPFDSADQKWLVLANVQRLLVECRRGLRQYGEAARHQRRRVDYLEQRSDTPSAILAAEYQSLGALLTQAESYEGAVRAYEQSIGLLRVGDGGRELAQVLGELGKSLDRAARYDRALETFGLALEQYRELSDTVGAGKQHQRIGAIYLRRLDNAPRALVHFQAAHDAYREANEAGDVAETTIDLGLARRRLGEFAAALELFEGARAQAQKLGLRATLARALTETANTRWLRGEYQRALELVSESDRLALPLDLAFQLNVNNQLRALIFWELNEFDRAHLALDDAIRYAHLAEQPLEVATAHNNRGIILRRQQMYERALEAFDRALEIDTRVRSRWGMGYDQRNIGITLHRMGRLSEASGHLEQAVQTSVEIGDRVNEARALLALGNLRSDQARPDDAGRLLRQALDRSRELYLPEVEWRALHGLGRLKRDGGDAESALRWLQEGVKVVEGLQAGIKIDEFRAGLLANKSELYEDIIELLLDMERPEEAFVYAERSRARKFLDVLAGQNVELRSESERQLYARQQELARRIDALRQAVRREADAERRTELQAELDQVEQRFAGVLLEIRIANPALSGFVSVEAPRVADLEESLSAETGVGVVEYYLLADEVVTWVWDGMRLQVIRRMVPRERLEERIREFRFAIQNRDLVDVVLRQSQSLHQLLYAPVKAVTADADTVVVVPHGPLHYLPFAALHDGEAFVAERHALAYSPSVGVLLRGLQAPVARQRAELSVLAVGNPSVGDPVYDLPFAEQEVASIRRDFPQAETLTGEQATEESVTERMSRFDVVHVGAHGTFDPANPLFSRLILAPGERDGRLHLFEVTGLRLDARLVALSACQSGVGKLMAGDELVSLSRAFVYAGSRAVLSTLWRVDDVATALVMKHFYRNYIEATAAESLRRAQVQVMNDGRHYHPVYWAGIALSGDYR